MSWGFDWKPYVPVAQRKANAKAYALKLAKKEKRTLAPVELSGRLIAKSFWGKSWCEHLEQFSDYENRLPRGRTYVRNGSVIDLQISRGKISAIVSGSEIYKVAIDIKTLHPGAWAQIKKDCSRSVESLIDLLQGRFDKAIMTRLTERDTGLFPKPSEITMKCSCPDWAGMCKHVAATMYGVGARLDSAPELLFTLRDVDHIELISQAVAADNLSEALKGNAGTTLQNSDLGEIFGIDLDGASAGAAGATADTRPKGVGRAKKTKKAEEKAVPAPVAAPAPPPSRTKATKAAKKPSVPKKKPKG